MSSTRDPIAIVGIGCRFPGGADSPAQLYTLLCNGVDAIGDIPASRWDTERYYASQPQTPGRMASRRAGCLDNIESFAAEFFGIAPRIAEQMDPQQRLLLEVTWESLEDAGIVPATLAGSHTGVYIGVCSHDYGDIQSTASELEGLNAHSATGNFMSIVANRLSYTLDLRGPSMVIDTACSSSLVAVHLACNALRAAECELAVAGGVNVMLSPHFPISLSQATMLSPDGVSRAFDATANGYVRGEGAGVVVLKSLRQALRDQDRIYALIRGTAVNQDGRTPGITVPGFDSQQANFHAALRQAGVAPAQVGYVEAHGTGTPVGDPIEANALGSVLNADQQRDPAQTVFIGSIKTNIGHLEAGAGIAGLIKAALVVQHRQIPPSLHFTRPNPQIDFAHWHMQVPTRLEAWPAGYDRAIASVNSFGFGGTNANAIVEEPPTPEEPLVPSAAPERLQLLPLSARSETVLQQLAQTYTPWLEAAAPQPTGLEPIAALLARRRSHHTHRLALLAATPAEAAATLRTYLEQGQAAGLVTGQQRPGTPRKLAFVFNGQGPQWWAMGRALITQEPVVAEVIQTCDTLARRHIDWSISAALMADEADSRVQETPVLQPTMFALQMGLVALWRAWGVEPQGVVGHSLGDITSACVAGIIDLPTALQIICHRARIQGKADPQGGMVYATLPLAEAQDLCRQYPDRLWLSAINGPKAVTLSGDRALLSQVQDALQAHGVFARLLRVNCACHSPHMDPLEEELMHCIRDVRMGEERVPFYSTVSGKRTSGGEISVNYWWQNFRQPVCFYEAIRTMLSDGFNTFVEISPHPVLVQTTHDILHEHSDAGVALPSLRRGEDDHRQLLTTLAHLYTCGVDIDWERRHPGPVPQFDAPRPIWEREAYWAESKVGKALRTAPQPHPMLRRVDEAMPVWETRWDDHRLSWVKEHKVFGGVVVPAAAYLEMTLAATAEYTGQPCVLEHVEFERPCVLAEGEPMMTRVALMPETGTFELHSRAVREDTWTRHVKGRYWLPEAEPGVPASPRQVDLAALRARCSVRHNPTDIYAMMAAKGYVYGPSFCGLRQYYTGASEGLARIEAPLLVRRQMASYRLHPVLLDACFQSAILHPAADQAGGALLQFSYLPTGAERVRLYGAVRFPVWCYTRVQHIGPEGFAVELSLLDDEGQVVAEFAPLRGWRVHEAHASEAPLSEHLYTYAWKQVASGAGSASAPFAVSPQALQAQIEPEIATLAQTLRRPEYHHAYASQVAALCAAYMVNALGDLGVEWQPGTELRAEQFPALRPSYRRFVEQCLLMLADDGLLRHAGNRFVVQQTPPAQDVEALFQALARQFPDCHAELMMLRRTGPHLASVLSGATDPLTLLFPAGSQEAAEPLYDTSPIARLYNTVVRRVVESVVAECPADQPLRVLEVGAGTGGLSAHLLPVLPAERTTYHFTDVSPTFLRAAEEKFAVYPFLTVDMFDVEEEPESQGFKPQSYDLIVASDVMHATRDLSASLAGLQSLLAPGGVLAMIEALPGNRWLHLTFGLTEGWWRFQDFNLRRRGPLLPPERWLDLLQEAEFEEAVSLSDVASDNTSGQFVLLARAPRTGAERLAERWSAGPATTGDWLFFLDRDGLGEQLATEVERRGGRAVRVAPLGALSSRHDIAQIAADDAPGMQRLVATGRWEGVVHLWNLDLPSGVPDASMLEEAVVTGSLSVSYLIAALAAPERHALARTRLFVVTRGTQPIRNTSVSLTQAPVWGLSLVCGLELPEVCSRMIDVPARATAEEAYQVWQELWREDEEREVALRGTDRLVRRVRRLAAETRWGIRPSSTLLAAGQAFHLRSESDGALDHLAYVACPRVPPGPGQVEVEVRAAGLNFLDVMTALGQVPRLDGGGKGLGGECAGVITRVGPGVAEFRPGDEVIVVRGELGAMASHLTTSAVYVFPKPSHLSFEAASELPIAFLTAWYALRELARVAPGERVLIHSATGGTGLACVQMARHLGAEVYATAGNDEKRDYLHALGIQHVLSSRTLAFADQIRQLTNGQGVDVVVNSLAGDAAARGIACLAPYGRFVEIGKRDFLQDRNLGLRPFLQNLAYLSFDLRQLLVDRPERVRAAFLDILALFAAGRLQPLPHRVLHPAQVQQGLRQMSRASHIGKLTVAMQETPLRVASQPASSPLAAGGTWLLAGGLGGVGMEMAAYLAAQGIRSLVLLGRTVDAAQQERLRQIEAETGAQILAAAVDICDRTALEALLQQIDRTLPPLQGVVHCAMVLDDTVITGLTADAMQRVVRPKMLGAWHLHELTAERNLAAFILFSSMTSMLGNQGQGNYAVANTFLDALAAYRHERGLPVTCVNWGVLADAGYVARHAGLQDKLAAIGAGGITTAEAFGLLFSLVGGQEAQVGAFRIDWQRYSRAALYEGIQKHPRYEDLVGEEASDSLASASAESGILTQFQRQGQEERLHFLQEQIRRRVAKVLGLPAEKLEPQRPLTEYLDSLLVVELVSWIEKEFHTKYTLMDIMRGPSIGQLAAELRGRLEAETSAMAR